MDERTEARVLFLASAALAIFGIFAPFKWHDVPSWITNSALALALFLGLWAVCLSLPAPSKGLKKLLAAILIAGGITATVFGFVLYFEASASRATAAFPRLEDYFVRDFNFLSLNSTISERAQNPANGLDVTVEIPFRLYQDFTTNTEFITVLVPFFSDIRLSEIVLSFLEHLKSDIIAARTRLRSDIGTGGSTPGSPMSFSKDLSFSGRVFLYTMNPLDPVQIGELVSSYRKDGLMLEIRGSDYLYVRSRAPDGK
jgi:hypothetical protein